MTKFLQKVILGALLATSGMVAAPLTAAANPTRAHASHYTVYYRTCVHSQWVRYYTFSCPVEANRYANWIRTGYGYEVFVR